MRFNLPSGSLAVISLPTYTAAANNASKAIGLSRMAKAKYGMASGRSIVVASVYHQKAGE